MKSINLKAFKCVPLPVVGGKYIGALTWGSCHKSMLDALEVVARIETECPDGEWGSTEWCEWVGHAVNQAKEAIAKAKGGQA